MTDKNLTEVAIILDRSGSMESIREDMEGGFARFVKDQRKLPGECVLSLYQFDDEYEVVYEEKDIQRVTKLGLVPRGGTALLDAVGRSIVKIGERLAKKSEDERPGGVIVLIITDGHENASREYTKGKVRQMIGEQESKWNWKFIYLSADAKAFDDAVAMGMSHTHVGVYGASAGGTRALYSNLSANVGSYRSAVANSRAEEWTAGGLGAVLADENEDEEEKPVTSGS